MTVASPPHAPEMHEVAERCLDVLRLAGAGLPSRPVDWSEFSQLSALVHRTFVIPSTTFTPMMRRLTFAISSCLRPAIIVGAGTYVGYTLAWLARARPPIDATTAQHIVGIDTDRQANQIARRNVRHLQHGRRLRFVDGDARVVLPTIRGPIDLLYVDIDSPSEGKVGYKDVLAAALPCLRSGAVVLAHDPSVPIFAGDFAVYDAFVRSRPELMGPWTLPVDPCGLSVAVVR